MPFTNVNVRPSGVPRAADFKLPELNLRTYVKCDGESGAYFFSLDAEGVLGVVGARLFHRLPYYYARISLTDEDNRISFRSRRMHPDAPPARLVANYEPVGDEYTAEKDSLDEYLVERYRYYTESDGEIWYADVEHGNWKLQEVEAEISENTLFEVNGFLKPENEPVLHYSKGLDVKASENKKWNQN